MNSEKCLNAKIKKTLIIRKYNSYLDKERKIIKEIDNYLKTERIFDENNKIFLNKLIKTKCPRYDKNKKLIPYSFVGPEKIFHLKRRKGIKNRTPLVLNDILQNKIVQNYLNQVKDKDKDNNPINIKDNKENIDNKDYIDNKDNDMPDEHEFLENSYEITEEENNIRFHRVKKRNDNNEEKNKFNYYTVIDNEDLKNIYHNIYDKIKKYHSIPHKTNKLKTKSKAKSNDNMHFKTCESKGYPENLRNILFRQEKVLTESKNFEKVFEKINNRILLKTHKNKNNNLLLNSNNNSSRNNKFYQIKINNINNTNNNYRNWNFKLRNPKINGEYKRNGYFLVSALNEELYSTVNLNKDNEIFANPLLYSEKNSFNGVNKKSKKKLNKEYEKIKSLETLKIKGNNLFEYEFRNEMKIKGKKKLYDKYKLDEFNFKEKNKEKISNFDIENNIKEFYSNKIFASNYDNNNYSFLHNNFIKKKI